MIQILIAVLFIATLYWWFIVRNTPKYPPLIIENNDPLMLYAIKKAKDSIDIFKILHIQHKDYEAQVKIKFCSNSGETEFIWAEVLNIIGDTISLRYLTPPVSHQGKFERVHEYKLSEICDWVVFKSRNEIYGGFTQQVMFEKAIEQWDKLPHKLEMQKKLYIPLPELKGKQLF